MSHDDWHAFSMELWGIHVTSWQPTNDRVDPLPEPMEYDVLQEGLTELDVGQRHALLQCISCYQVRDLLVLNCHKTISPIFVFLLSNIFIRRGEYHQTI
jgi:hypothetical protein